MEIDALRTLPPGDWDAVQRNFRWSIASDFNIARAACDAWAEDDPARVAIVDVGANGQRRLWTFGELKDASDRLAQAFLSWGVGRGDVVAVLLPQAPEVMVAHFAAMKIGAISLPLFTLFGPDALAFRLSDSGAKVALTDSDNIEKLQSVAKDCDALTHIVNVEVGGGAGVIRLDDVLSEMPPLSQPIIGGANDPAMLIYTSGTTGAPKGALHAHRFLIGHLPSVEMVLERFPQAGDVGWTPADWAWIGGLMDLAMPCLYFGVPLIAHRMRKFEAEAAFDLMLREGVSVSFLPPTALKMMRLCEVPDGLKLRAVGSGGESLGADLLEWGRDVLGAPINELYGQTECNLVVSSCARLGIVAPGTMGFPVPGHEVAVLGADGQPVAVGEVGEISVRRGDPVMFLEYWKQPEKTAEKFNGEWLKTGDLAHMDEAGHLIYSSRDDDVITSAGYRIGPTEIENCLCSDADVLMAAAVGVPDPARTEIVKAFVVLRPGVDEAGVAERLVKLVRERVSPHVAPRAIAFVDDLPKTATGKIMRRALRRT